MNIVSSRRSGFYRHGYHLGQFDPSGGITGDIMLGPQDVTPVQPDYGTTSTQGFPDYGATPQNAPAPAVSVPKPASSSPIYATFGPYGTVDPTATGTLPPGPSPRVNVPLAPSSIGMFLTNSSLMSGIPNWIVIGGGLLAIPLLGGLIGGGGGGRRRRR